MAVANARPNALAVAALGMSDGESLLELGCGPGHALQKLLLFPRLERDNRDSTGPKSCSRRQPIAIGGRLRPDGLVLVRGDFAKLPFTEEFADAVLAVNVAYFMQTPRRCVKRIACCVKAAGLCFMRPMSEQ